MKRQEKKELYFSTKKILTINGVKYRPSICYPVPPLAKGSLEKLDGVTFYERPVRFVNGAVASSAKNSDSAAATGTVKSAASSEAKEPSSTPVEETSAEVSTTKEKGKKVRY